MPKPYFDYMNEITPDDLYYGLVSHGLFAEKLPPFLSGEAFYQYLMSTSPCFADKPRQFIGYESIRNTNVPRQMGIPHPLAHQRLCACLKEHWNQIQEHFRTMTANQYHKVSRIHLRKMYDNPRLFEMNYHNWYTDPSPDIDLMFGKRYVVSADISNCFPSIYSHALAWALVGKKNAQSNRDPKLWFNQIDHYAQNSKNGETHGLLIGPHTSNLLSEIILTTVDYELYEKGWCYIRHIDDYTCYTETHEMAQSFIIELNKSLQSFGLTLNHKKTNIQSLPQVSESQWVRKINTFDFGANNLVIDYKQIRAFLDEIIELIHKNNSDASILNYAMKVLSKRTLTYNARSYYIKAILNLALIYPYLVHVLDEVLFVPFGLEVYEIDKFSNKLFKNEIEKANYDAVSYALFFAIKYHFELTKIDVQRIIDSNNSIVLLLAYLYYETHSNPQCCKQIKDHAKSIICTARGSNPNYTDFEQNWLFVYEVLQESCLIEGWKQMKQAGVSFVDRTKLNI